MAGILNIGRADPTDVFLVTGQSNAVAQEATSFSGTAAHLQAADSGIHIWNGSSFVALVNGVNSNPLYPSAPAGVFGPEAEFGYQYRLANPAKPIYFVKFCVSGTCLFDDGTTNNWSPGHSGGLFQQMTGYVQSAISNLVASGLRPVIRAELNMQGESDATTAQRASVYETNKGSYIAAARSLWGDINTKILMGRISTSDAEPFTSTVYTAQTNVAAANSSFVRLINTDTYPLFTDNIHYTSPGIVSLGGDMWTAYLT